jgi:hypothetical protein
MFLASVGVYGLVGLLKFFLPGEHAAAPSLAYVLLLVMVACWGLAGGAFFLDRYRVPILLPLGLWWLITSQVFPSDHYYLVQDGVSQVTPIPPAELIQKGTGRAIVVAAQGGGIQAAAGPRECWKDWSRSALRRRWEPAPPTTSCSANRSG